MIKLNENDDDDFEPIFYVSYIDEGDYWAQYNTMKKSWSRLCDQCSQKICKSSNSLCTFHLKQSKEKLQTIEKKSKRVNTHSRTTRNRKKKKNEEMHSIESNIEIKVDKNFSMNFISMMNLILDRRN